jgi:hypothetical protein
MTQRGSRTPGTQDHLSLIKLHRISDRKLEEPIEEFVKEYQNYRGRRFWRPA